MDIKELHAGTGKNHPWEYARFQVVVDILKQYLHSKKSCNAYDIGCGDAFFISSLARKYSVNTYVGVDIALDDTLLRQLQEQYSGITFLNKIPSCPDKKADLILLLDVIEHIEDDGAFLKELLVKNFINDNGLLMIAVPAFQSLFSQHDKWLGHYRRYKLPDLTHLVAGLNLTLLDKGYFFKSLVLFRFFQKIKEKVFAAKSRSISCAGYEGIGGWKGGKVISYLYRNILYLDFLFFNRLLRLKKVPGLSCYVLCKLKGLENADN